MSNSNLYLMCINFIHLVYIMVMKLHPSIEDVVYLLQLLVATITWSKITCNYNYFVKQLFHLQLLSTTITWSKIDWSTITCYYNYLIACKKLPLPHTDKSFLNLIKSNQIWTLTTLFKLIWYQNWFCFVPNQSGK